MSIPPRIATLFRWLAGRTGRRAERRFRIRGLVQIGFAALCVLLGVQFSRFVSAAQAARLPLPHRPAGVEAFLPISGLMGLVDWAHRGTLNRVHPAASVLVLVALGLALLLRRSWCSWVCPMGFLSESLARLGRRVFGRNIRPWRWLDAPLRALKYLLLAFFLWAIVSMTPQALSDFLHSPYNRLADVKMELFFTDLGRVGVGVLGVLVVGSMFVEGLWCRYLCPYGALLGLFSWASPVKIRRKADACVSCGLCDRACMARIRVSSKQAVWSAECTGCLDCVAACPRKGALAVGLRRRRLAPLGFAAAVVGLFLAGWLGARVAGTWQTGMSDAEYVQRIHEVRSAAYAHPATGALEGMSAGTR